MYQRWSMLYLVYTPPSFRVDNKSTIHAFIQEHSFATFVSNDGTRLNASHLPCLLDPHRGTLGTLRAHMARANPQWKSWTNERELLIMFTGPHAYISPAWYHNQKTVPTWNYAAVHAYGIPRLISDEATLATLVRDQVKLYESKEGEKWDQSLMEDVMADQLKGIVGFTIEIDRVETTFKFNQNRPHADQDGVISTLGLSECPFKRAVGRFMRSLRQTP